VLGYVLGDFLKTNLITLPILPNLITLPIQPILPNLITLPIPFPERM
jgi:hypothetical protein